MEYTTQMDAARKGIATPQMKAVAEKEHMPLERLMELVAKGPGGHLRQQGPHLPGPPGRGQHAAHQNPT